MRAKRKTTKSFIKECHKRHSNFYDYKSIVYIGCYEMIDIICPKHGAFKQRASEHLSGKGCTKCGNLKTRLSNTKDFIIKANIVHHNFYKYNKVNYTGAKKFITITCPIHGDFEQRPNYHLSGNGCTKCYKENNGFGKTKFIHSCRNTNLGRLYIIKCYSENEEFIKIGITSQTIKERFKRFSRFPYSYEVLYQKEDVAEKIFNLEKHYHRALSNYKYQPNILFKGSSECFSTIIENYDFRRDEKSS